MVVSLVVVHSFMGAMTARAELEAPRVSGGVRLDPTDVVVIHVSALQIGGWQGLHQVRAELMTAGDVVQTVAFDIEDSMLSLGDARLKVGTGATVAGPFFRVRASDVIVTSGAGRFEFRLRAALVRALPDDASFRLSAVNDDGAAVSVRRRPASPAERAGGVPWGAAAVGVVIALVLGGLAGNAAGSRRRPIGAVGVYGALTRRLREPEERPTAGTP